MAFQNYQDFTVIHNSYIVYEVESSFMAVHSFGVTRSWKSVENLAMSWLNIVRNKMISPWQVCKLATDYIRTCVSPDENKNNEENSNTVSPDSCDVYVWGSNSSHQLAAGSQEKVLTPKLAPAFTNVQQVRLCKASCFYGAWESKR